MLASGPCWYTTAVRDKFPLGVQKRREGLLFSVLLPAGSLATDGAYLSVGVMSLSSFSSKRGRWCDG